MADPAPADGRSGDIRWPIQHRLMADQATSAGPIQHRLMADQATSGPIQHRLMADQATSAGRSSTG
jgi:hypothetical protein